MFFGAALMVAFMADGDHDAGLIVVPAMRRNPGALTQFRARAIGSHQQTRIDNASVAQRHVDATRPRVETCYSRGAQIDTLGLRARDQRMKAQEKVKRREEDAIRRKAERDGLPTSDPAPEES